MRATPNVDRHTCAIRTKICRIACMIMLGAMLAGCDKCGDWFSPIRGQAQFEAQVCREHNVADELVSRWRQEFLERAPQIFMTARTRSAEQERIVELERLVGQLTLELNILKKASQVWVSPSRRNGSS